VIGRNSETPTNSNSLSQLAKAIEVEDFEIEGAPEGAKFTVDEALVGGPENNMVEFTISVVPEGTPFNEDQVKTGISKIEKDGTTIAEKFSATLGTIADVLSLSPVTPEGAGFQTGAGELMRDYSLTPPPYGDVVAGLELAEVVRIQNALCLDEQDGAWGDITQEALTVWRRGDEGQLTDEEKVRLIGLTREEIANQCRTN